MFCHVSSSSCDNIHNFLKIFTMCFIFSLFYILLELESIILSFYLFWLSRSRLLCWRVICTTLYLKSNIDWWTVCLIYILCVMFYAFTFHLFLIGSLETMLFILKWFLLIYIQIYHDFCLHHYYGDSQSMLIFEPALKIPFKVLS